MIKREKYLIFNPCPEQSHSVAEEMSVLGIKYSTALGDKAEL